MVLMDEAYCKSQFDHAGLSALNVGLARLMPWFARLLGGDLEPALLSDEAFRRFKASYPQKEQTAHMGREAV